MFKRQLLIFTLSLITVSTTSLSTPVLAQDKDAAPVAQDKAQDKQDKAQDKTDKKAAAKEDKKKKEDDQATTLQMMDLFGDVFEKVRSDYVEEVSDKKLIEAAINGMLTSLDPHSSFLNADDYKDMQEQTKGEFGGLGIEVTLKNGLVYVVAPIDDTPAFKAGIKAGDYISHIDGEAVYGMTIGDAVKKMRGKPGENITLKIIREGDKKPFDVTLARDIIKIKSVKSKTYDDVGYIRITSFTENTGKQVADAINKILKDAGKDKIKGFVLDLRNNPGGLLTEAISVSDDFLVKGEVVSTRGRNPRDSQKFSATAGDVTNGMPLVVLINSGSASASEIVSGALQDQKRALIMGEKSFGKGSVQTVIPVSSDSAIRLTTSRYYTPSGKSIQAEGITPDIEVKQGKLTYEDEIDRTKEADLKGHLANPDKQEAKIKNVIAKLKKDKNADITEDDLNVDASKDEDKPLEESDYQLFRGLDMVRALSVYKQSQQ